MDPEHGKTSYLPEGQEGQEAPSKETPDTAALARKELNDMGQTIKSASPVIATETTQQVREATTKRSEKLTNSEKQKNLIISQDLRTQFDLSPVVSTISSLPNRIKDITQAAERAGAFYAANEAAFNSIALGQRPPAEQRLNIDNSATA